MTEYLLFKLGPGAAGDHRDPDHLDQPSQKRGHFRVERRFAFRQCAVQIEYNEASHGNSGTAISSSVTWLAGRNRHTPTSAGSVSRAAMHNETSLPVPIRMTDGLPPDASART